MPKSITIVQQKIIAEQNLLNLRDILTTLPGITFGAGEGGGGYGDSINLRGFTGSTDITVDGDVGAAGEAAQVDAVAVTAAALARAEGDAGQRGQDVAQIE